MSIEELTEALAFERARAGELTEALAAAKERISNQRDQIHQHCVAAGELGTRVRELEAELERQVAYHCQQTANSARVFEAAEQQLAAANALLDRVRRICDSDGFVTASDLSAPPAAPKPEPWFVVEQRVLLAALQWHRLDTSVNAEALHHYCQKAIEARQGQPAAPTCAACGAVMVTVRDGFGEAFSCPKCDQPAAPTGNKPPFTGHAIQYAHPSTYRVEPFPDAAPTDHDRAVLDAMSNVPTGNVRALSGQLALKGLPELAQAELARRRGEAKR